MSAKLLFTFLHFKFPLLPLLTHSAMTADLAWSSNNVIHTDTKVKFCCLKRACTMVSARQLLQKCLQCYFSLVTFQCIISAKNWIGKPLFSISGGLSFTAGNKIQEIISLFQYSFQFRKNITPLLTITAESKNHLTHFDGEI